MCVNCFIACLNGLKTVLNVVFACNYTFFTIIEGIESDRDVPAGGGGRQGAEIGEGVAVGPGQRAQG